MPCSRPPPATRRLSTIVTGRDLAVATSGTAERGAHILHPRTGRPAASGLLSITLVGRHLTDTDAYATAAFAMGPDALDAAVPLGLVLNSLTSSPS